MREVLGGCSINVAFTEQRRDCEHEIEGLIRQRLAAYNAGIRIDSFQFLDAHAPSEVHDAFRDVASALEDKSTQINLALRDKARKIPLARGEAEQLVTAAEGHASRAVAEARGQVQSLRRITGACGSNGRRSRSRGCITKCSNACCPACASTSRPGGPEAGAIDIWLIDPKVGGGVPWQGDADVR